MEEARVRTTLAGLKREFGRRRRCRIALEAGTHSPWVSLALIEMGQEIARVATLLSEARGRGGALLVDAGGLRYAAEPVPPAGRAQAELKAEFLEQTWKDIGTVVDFVGVEHQALSRYTPDAGNHVSVSVHPAAALSFP